MKWIVVQNESEDPKLNAVLARLCEQLGDLWTTQAVKLPYLVDLVSQRIRGYKVTNSQHKAWKLGVVTARAWGLIKKEHGGRYFEVYGDAVTDGIRLRIKTAPPDVLDATEKQIVDFVAEEFGSMRPDKLGDLTKELNPEVKTWEGSTPVEMTDSAYERLPIGFGELEADAEDVINIKKLRVISGEEAENLLTEWAK
jgi:uncharacterized phage-associated protein